jgi:hypothetical protein
MAMNTLPAPVRPANPLYRVGRVGGGGLYNGYAAPRAKQRWEVGQVVNVGFIKGLVVKARVLTPGDGRPDICRRRTAFTSSSRTWACRASTASLKRWRRDRGPEQEHRSRRRYGAASPAHRERRRLRPLARR